MCDNAEIVYAKKDALSIPHRRLAMERVESNLFAHRSVAILVGWLTSVQMSKDGSRANLLIRESPVSKSNWFCQCDGRIARRLTEDDFLLIVARPVAYRKSGGGTTMTFIAELVIDLREAA